MLNEKINKKIRIFFIKKKQTIEIKNKFIRFFSSISFTKFKIFKFGRLSIKFFTSDKSNTNPAKAPIPINSKMDMIIVVREIKIK